MVEMIVWVPPILAISQEPSAVSHEPWLEKGPGVRPSKSAIQFQPLATLSMGATVNDLVTSGLPSRDAVEGEGGFSSS